ncbi:ferredoxin [Sphingobium chlorophenolicum L-1]|uniref:Ferredoxin n=1 Tax=Sphingobium chlorophenolicum L-1 TaxID=690566 RepID=F6F2M2_SPHCR|nr:2Fe-2S iron-sulfur cluster-binding protein [Sphingobium chlorophenolicum]AEG50684.1 ferredoxin [Sphingobium chlorophenolicum L-1]
MANLIVVDRSGQEHVIEAANGWSVMEAIRDNGIDELLALCGGCCSCATCHVYVDETQNARFAAMTDDENDLLDSSDYRKTNSRLSCQLIVDGTPEIIRLSIAPED